MYLGRRSASSSLYLIFICWNRVEEHCQADTRMRTKRSIVKLTNACAQRGTLSSWHTHAHKDEHRQADTRMRTRRNIVKLARACAQEGEENIVKLTRACAPGGTLSSWHSHAHQEGRRHIVKLTDVAAVLTAVQAQRGIFCNKNSHNKVVI